MIIQFLHFLSSKYSITEIVLHAFCILWKTGYFKIKIYIEICLQKLFFFSLIFWGACNQNFYNLKLARNIA